ncbi:MAG TPA: PEP-CTERM sorting domain-containing protein [Chthoniobacteraceae bacterium]
MTIGVTNFVVGRLTFNPQGTETFDLFINPAPGVVPTTPDASLSGFNLASVYYITFFGGNDVVIDDPSLSVIYQIDEIRGGTTYFDVVPEPSTALSLMLGFGLLVSRRRRSGVIGS